MKDNIVARETFVVQISSEKNATWQGSVTHAKGQKTQNFRSMLELVRLVDSALRQSQEQVM